MPNITDVYARNLDLNLLRVLLVVAEEGSLTRAASRLYVTQPAISSAMRRLTSFVGAELLTRQGHGLVLTTRGAEILSAARMHLPPLVSAATSEPVFDPKLSSATIRVGLGGFLEALLLPQLLSYLQIEAPLMQVVVLAVQFRTVEEMLLSGRIDFAVTVADNMPRSILRQPLSEPQSADHAYVCLYDPRFTKLPRTITQRDYFAQEHVAVSYAGDVRGIIEDALGKNRTVRVSVPSFGFVADIVDGSSLVATVPAPFGRHIVKTRPHLRTVAVPFSFESMRLELLWSRVSDDDASSRFVRHAVARLVGSLLEEESRGRRAGSSSHSASERTAKAQRRRR